MTKMELLTRLESISHEIDQLSEIVSQKNRDSQLELLQSIKNIENDVNNHMNRLEKIFDELETYNNKNQSEVPFVLAR